MKKFIKKIKYILLLLILSFFPLGISALIEFIIRDNCNITFDYLVVPLNLIAAIISLYVFKEKKIINIKNEFNPKLTMLCFLMGFTLKQAVILILGLLGANLTGEINYFLIFTAIFIAPIAEELQFRVILTDIINGKKQTISIITIFFTSITWTAVHLYGFSLATLFLFIDGLILGFLYQKTRNVIACVIYHLGNNLSASILLLLKDNNNLRIYLLVFYFLTAVISSTMIIKNYLLKTSDS